MLSYEGNISGKLKNLIDKEFNDLYLFSDAASSLKISVMAQGKGMKPDYVYKVYNRPNTYFYVIGLDMTVVKGSHKDIMEYIGRKYQGKTLKQRWAMEILDYIKRDEITDRVIFNNNFVDSRMDELIIKAKWSGVVTSMASRKAG